jgi:hypothetical protein
MFLGIRFSSRVPPSVLLGCALMCPGASLDILVVDHVELRSEN